MGVLGMMYFCFTNIREKQVWSCGISMNFLLFAGLICGHYIFDGLFGYQHTTLRPHQDKNVPNLWSISSLKYLLDTRSRVEPRDDGSLIKNLRMFSRRASGENRPLPPGSLVACPGWTMGRRWSWVCCCHRPPPWLLGGKKLWSKVVLVCEHKGGDLTCIDWFVVNSSDLQGILDMNRNG